MTAKPQQPQSISDDEVTKRRNDTAAWFMELRDRLCAEVEAIETEHEGDGKPATFERTNWQRARDENDNDGDGDGDTGGGEMSIMRGGGVFEKIGINISTVHGRFSDEFRGQIPGTENDARFWAAGISLVAHPANPFVPAVHMNTRYLNIGGGAHRWFGGGADLTPIMENEEDTADFHAALKQSCDAHDPGYYPRFKKWCDEYFYLPHRGETRGAGGIFFDNLDSGDFAADFAFVRAVGEAFAAIYPAIVRRRMLTPFSDADRAYQLMRRGRYAEFNLLYDRGTLFGLKTGGNTEAILMSLPPQVHWP